VPDHVKQRYFQGPSSGRVAPESCAAGWGLMSWTCDVSTSIVERLGFAAAVDVGVEDGGRSAENSIQAVREEPASVVLSEALIYRTPVFLAEAIDE